MRLRREKHLLEILEAAIAAVDGKKVVQDYLTKNPIQNKCSVIAIGKAAASMTAGAFKVLDENTQALVIAKYGHIQPRLDFQNIEYIEAGHPIPDQSSLDAGQKMLEFIKDQPGDGLILFLISGGTSSLVEVLNPAIYDKNGTSTLVEVLPEHVSLEMLQRVNKWLLSAGLDIHQMNEVRQSISLIKGGRLADFLEGRPALCLLISDVPGDDPAIIGSGMLVRENEGRRLTEENLPGWIRELSGRLPPVSAHGKSGNIDVHVIAGIQDALQAATRQSDDLGYHTVLHSELLSGDAIRTGERLAQILITEDSSDPVVHIWGGETTVRLPDEPGNGGRNQSLALAAARKIKNDNRISLLAVGTDGTDGPGEDAGALVDSDTIMRGEQDELDAQDCLDRADAGSFLQASGDLIHTGPTGTNVMDIVIGLKA